MVLILEKGIFPQLIDTAYDAEKYYVGVNVGTLALLYLDCADGSYELVPAPTNMKPSQIAVFFSGLEHALAGSKYNLRVDELQAGIYALMAYAELDYGKFSEANARNVSLETYQKYKDRPPIPWAKRREHW